MRYAGCPSCLLLFEEPKRTCASCRVRLVAQDAMPTAPTEVPKVVDEYFAARPVDAPGFTEESAASALAHADEPPLLSCPPLALRLLVMPSFESNTIVRVESVDRAARLVACGLTGGNQTTIDRALGTAERHELRDVIAAANLGALAYSERRLGTDGVTSLFEAFDGERHVIRHRWSLSHDTASRGLTSLRMLQDLLLRLAGESHRRR
jgi:hypothetical protein